jgi:hypothetical protein
MTYKHFFMNEGGVWRGSVYNCFNALHQKAVLCQKNNDTVKTYLNVDSTELGKRRTKTKFLSDISSNIFDMLCC